MAGFAVRAAVIKPFLMPQIAYHASHEQFTPSTLLKLARMAEQAGFDAIHSSDHFYPWSERQGQSGFSFAWLGAAMQCTSLPFSVICAPGPRYHPAVIAQAVATLAEMFPNRFSVELGSGEALNEWMTGKPWPSKEARNERLLQAARIIQQLLRGEEVTDNGPFTIREAKLYTLPAQVPLVFGAAITAKTAGWCGQWADGLLITAGTLEDTIEKITAFNRGGGAGKPIFVQLSFSFHPDHDMALAGAHDQWRTNVLDPEELANYYKPAHFDKAAEKITPAMVAGKLPIYTCIRSLFVNITALTEAGASRIILHNVNRHQELFLRHFQDHKASLLLKTGLENF
jgi:coenzyme F420-dependent glucose-6-phosphate dehydrogenase